MNNFNEINLDFSDDKAIEIGKRVLNQIVDIKDDETINVNYNNDILKNNLIDFYTNIKQYFSNYEYSCEIDIDNLAIKEAGRIYKLINDEINEQKESNCAPWKQGWRHFWVACGYECLVGTAWISIRAITAIYAGLDVACLIYSLIHLDPCITPLEPQKWWDLFKKLNDTWYYNAVKAALKFKEETNCEWSFGF